jgi:hypothetical protein
MTTITITVHRINGETGARTEVQGKTTHLCPPGNPSDKGFGFPPCTCPRCVAAIRQRRES